MKQLQLLHPLLRCRFQSLHDGHCRVVDLPEVDLLRAPCTLACLIRALGWRCGKLRFSLKVLLLCLLVEGRLDHDYLGVAHLVAVLDDLLGLLHGCSYALFASLKNLFLMQLGFRLGYVYEEAFVLFIAIACVHVLGLG